MKSILLFLPTTLAATFGLSSCVVAPNVYPPSAAQPAEFKGTSIGETLDRANWWELFDDSTLNELVAKIERENMTLQAALARVDQAYAVLGAERSSLVPNLNGSGSVVRNQNSKNDLGGNLLGGINYTQYHTALALGWEIDFWGRVRSLVNGRQAEAKAAEALAADVKIALQGQLVRSYFSLRFIDEEKSVLHQAVNTRLENLSIAKDRLKQGAAGELDVARADSELATTQAQLAQLDGARIRFENAIAALIGQAPSEFRLSPGLVKYTPPKVGSGLPMEMLSFRPDVAVAQRTLEVTSAQIGVATAEFFPRVSLIGSGGLSSNSSSNFLDWSSRTFSIGPQVSVPIFQGGLLRANYKRACAEHTEAVANYQQTVLEALQEVEDALADLAALQAEGEAQIQAVKASQRARELSTLRYEEGEVGSIEVIDAVRTELEAERRAVQIRSLRFEATTRLIQALGGGFRKSNRV